MLTCIFFQYGWTCDCVCDNSVQASTTEECKALFKTHPFLYKPNNSGLFYMKANAINTAGEYREETM